MSPEQETFVRQMAQQTETHEQWLELMSFGLKTLLETPTFLLEVVWAEVERRNEKGNSDIVVLAEYLDELGLSIVPTHRGNNQAHLRRE